MTIAVSTASVRFADSIADEIEAVYDEITSRAYKLFLARRGEGTLDIEDWLLAERELLIKPPAHIWRTPDQLEVTIDLNDVSPTSIEIVIALQTLLIHSLNSTAYPKIFRTVNLPSPIDPERIQIRYRDGFMVLAADISK